MRFTSATLEARFLPAVLTTVLAPAAPLSGGGRGCSAADMYMLWSLVLRSTGSEWLACRAPAEGSGEAPWEGAARRSDDCRGE